MQKTFLHRLKSYTIQNSTKAKKVSACTSVSKITVGMGCGTVLSLVRKPDEVVHSHNIISPGGPVFPDYTWIWNEVECSVEIDFLQDRVLKVNVSYN